MERRVEGCAWKIGQRGGKIEKRKEKREEKKAAERVKSPRVVRSKHHRALRTGFSAGVEKYGRD